MQKILTPIIKNIDQEIDKFVQTYIAQAPHLSARPKWTRANANLLQNQINQLVSNIIAANLIQAKLPANNPHPQALFSALASYTKLRTAEILKKNHSSDQTKELNKKIFTAKRLLGAFLDAIYQFHKLQYRKKLYKKLAKLLAALEKKSKEVISEAQPTPEPQPTSGIFVPGKIFYPALICVPNYQLLLHFRTLGLKLGANHQEIKAAFEKFLAGPKSTPEELAKFTAASEAYQALIKIEAHKLAGLAEVNGTEIQELAANLRGQRDILNNEVSVKEIETAIYQTGILKAVSSSSLSPEQLQNMQVTLEKLRDKFGDTQKIDLRQSFLETRKTVTLSPR